MRFVADMHISPLTVDALNAASYHTVRVDAILPQTVPDSEIIEAARRRGAAIITFDLDFSAHYAIKNDPKRKS